MADQNCRAVLPWVTLRPAVCNRAITSDQQEPNPPRNCGRSPCKIR